MKTPYHSAYWAHALTLQGPPGTVENLSRSMANARVDLNPHKVDAARFAVRSPFTKGVLLADEVGLGKTIEAGIVIAQRWASGAGRFSSSFPRRCGSSGSRRSSGFGVRSVPCRSSDVRKVRERSAMSFPRRSIVLAGAFVLSATTAAAADLPVTASLSLSPSTTLPGTPVAFIVTIYNPNDGVYRIGNFAKLSVTSAAGMFDAVGLDHRPSIVIPSDALDRCGDVACLQVPGRSQRQLYIDVGPTLAGNEFFADRRLSVPGSYALQLTLNVTTNDGRMAQLRTDSVIMTIEQPTSTDLAVWQRLQQIAGATGWGVADWILSGDTVATEIRTKYPSSHYAHWVAAMGRVTTPEATIAQLDSALATNPPSSLRDSLLFVKASFAAQASGHALEVDRDIDRALAFADMARTAFATLERFAISDVMRARATDGLARLYTRRTADDTLRLLAANDPPAPLNVIPHLECVTLASGTAFAARFGYSNPNGVIKVLPLGNLNEVTPAPRDQGQPHVFGPGDIGVSSPRVARAGT